jgi:hypothetical protein
MLLSRTVANLVTAKLVVGSPDLPRRPSDDGISNTSETREAQTNSARRWRVQVHAPRAVDVRFRRQHHDVGRR